MYSLFHTIDVLNRIVHENLIHLKGVKGVYLLERLRWLLYGQLGISISSETIKVKNKRRRTMKKFLLGTFLVLSIGLTGCQTAAKNFAVQ